MSDSNLTNPIKAFFHDEFPEQYQEAPGLQKNMKPVPDCGEKSYKGSGKLTGRKALVTGGDSGMGGGPRLLTPEKVPMWPLTTCPRNSQMLKR